MQYLDFPWCKTKNCLHSFDAHFQEVVALSSLAFFPRKAAYTLLMSWHGSITLQLFKMQDQTLRTLTWHLFLGGDDNIANTIYTHNGSKYFDNSLMSLYSAMIIHDETTKIVDALLCLMHRR